MGKSILVMETPKRCMECQMCFHADDLSIGKFEYKRLYSCRFAPSDAEDFYLPDISSTKPDWCPLQDMPERKGSIRGSLPKYDTDNHYEIGWNDCLDQILNGG